MWWGRKEEIMCIAEFGQNVLFISDSSFETMCQVLLLIYQDYLASRYFLLN